MGDALFDMDPVAVPPVPVDDRPLAVRRIAAGGHPLVGVDPTIHLHPLADRTAAPGDPNNLPYRCGSCRFRQLFGYHRRTYPKCTARGQLRVSHSDASDVRAWWPACRQYEPGDGRLSADAARGIPGGAADG